MHITSIYKTLLVTSALCLTTACQTLGTNAAANTASAKSEAEMQDCIRTVMKLDEGRWDYMGTIARGNGKFRTYTAVSVHAAAGPDKWSSYAFGGDFGGTEEEAEISYKTLVGTSIVPVNEDGSLDHDGAVRHLDCTGPDAEGRYQTQIEYKETYDGKDVFYENIGWYSEHGSYYAEDVLNHEGRIFARRSGVNTPVEN